MAPRIQQTSHKHIHRASPPHPRHSRDRREQTVSAALSRCVQRLRELGHDYGDMPAHDLLWEGCRASAADVSARLAIVPMSQEARGLDAGPRLVGRLVGMGDIRSAAVVRRISEEERAHVAVGVLWFRRICATLGHGDGGAAWYRSIVGAVNPDASILKGPFNHADRELVGFPQDWYSVEVCCAVLRCGGRVCVGVGCAVRADHAASSHQI